MITDLVAALRRTHPPGQLARTEEWGNLLWNAAVRHRPAAVLRCGTAADVRSGVDAARECAAPLAVRGGGHGWAGRALADGGLTLDLSGMRRVRVDPAARVAHVQGGATAADLVAAVHPHGLLAVTGTAGGVGMAGLGLGGGYGPLSGRFGLAADNLLGVELVLADGLAVSADAECEPELFWAVRGGGGNFGVVTGLRIRLHEAPALLPGMVMYPAAQADSVLAALAGLLPDGTSDELTVQCGFVTAPDGSPVLFLAPTWCGDAAAGERALAGFARLGDPLMAQLGPATQPDLLAGTDALFPPGRHVAIGTRTVAAPAEAVRAALVAAGTAPTSPFSAVAVHSLHGAAARVPVGDTAFGRRDPHLVVEAIAAWEPGDPREPAHRGWVRDLIAALEPHALPGGYPNLLDPDDHDRAADAYGPNLPRLLAAKERYDPEGVFAATPLPNRRIPA